MMNHKLRLLILKHLSEKPRAGYGLIKDIEEHTGWKPSYGSIYPELDRLHKEGIIEFEEQGKKKVYHLTPKGKEALKGLPNRSEVVSHLRAMEQLMVSLCGEKSELFFNYVASSLDKGEMPFSKEVMHAGYGLRSQLARIHKQGLDAKQRRRAVAILKEATKRLEEIR